MYSVLFCIVSVYSAGWDYDDIAHWGDAYPECNGLSQSPINIPTFASDNCGILDHLQLIWHLDLDSTTFMVSNTGHSLKIKPVTSNSSVNNMEWLTNNTHTLGKLINIYYNTYDTAQDLEYCLDSIHFHWGTSNSVGSEHTYDGESYPLEAHFVHYSCDYADINEAINAYLTDNTGENSNILAVVGVMFEIGEANEAIGQIVSQNIINVTQYYNSTEAIYVKINADWAHLIPFEHDFIGYHGSLTTPPCLETVHWHVMTHKLTLSESQLNQFRLLYTGINENSSYIGDNWRPVQQQNNTILYSCASDFILEIDDPGAVTISKTGIIIMIIGLALSVLVCAALIIQFIIVPKYKSIQAKTNTFRANDANDVILNVEQKTPMITNANNDDCEKDPETQKDNSKDKDTTKDNENDGDSDHTHEVKPLKKRQSYQ